MQESVVLAASSTAVNGQGRQQLLSRVRDHITAKLGFTEVIDPDQPLNELGLDSLMAVALSNSLEQEFGTPVSVRELIKGPTINQLVDGVFRELSGGFPRKAMTLRGPHPLRHPLSSLRERRSFDLPWRVNRPGPSCARTRLRQGQSKLREIDTRVG